MTVSQLKARWTGLVSLEVQSHSPSACLVDAQQQELIRTVWLLDKPSLETFRWGRLVVETYRKLSPN